MVSLLRQPDEACEYDVEPDCKRALAKALGALAIAGETAPDSDWQQLPETIGEYEIVRPLGRGGMGRVFLARHSKLGRQVALKLALIDRLADPRIRRRFDSEMRAVGKLSHPNIVTAHDAREIDGTAVLGWCREVPANLRTLEVGWEHPEQLFSLPNLQPPIVIQHKRRDCRPTDV